MPDFHAYLQRHGEAWVLDIILRMERYAGIRPDANLSLEQRWQAVMVAPVTALAA